MSIHPRRALAEAEAAAWLDLHSDWAADLPAAEPPDVQVRGRLFHDHIGDGWGPVGRQAPARRAERPARVTRRGDVTVTRVLPAPSQPSSRPVPYVPDSAYDEALPTLSRERVHSETAFLFDPQFEAHDADSHRWGLGARRSALSQMQRAGRLSETTTLVDQRVPRALLYDVAADCAIRRTTRVVRASALDHVLDAVDPRTEDSCWRAQLAASELEAWCRERLTQRQYECLVSDDLSDPAVRRARSRALDTLRQELPLHLRGLRRVAA